MKSTTLWHFPDYFGGSGYPLDMSTLINKGNYLDGYEASILDNIYDLESE